GVAGHGYFVGSGDGIPNTLRRVIPNFNPISAARPRHTEVRLTRHRFGWSAGFLGAVAAVDAQMHLSIYRFGVLKNRRPIDAPISKNRAWIACDGEEKGRTINTRQFDGIRIKVGALLLGKRRNRIRRHAEI